MNAIDYSLSISLLIKISLLLLAVVFLLGVLRKSEPRLRVMMVRAAVFVLPILLWGAFSEPVFKVSDPFRPVVVTETGETTSLPMVVSEEVNVASLSAEEIQAANFAVKLPAVLFTVWLLVAMLLLVRDFIGMSRLRKKGRASRAAEQNLAARWQQICREFEIRHEVKLVVQKGELSESPFLCPGLQPILVLPSGMTEKFDPETLDQVFRHEAAHISRGDVMWMPLIRFVTCLFWFHPLMWVISAMHLRSCEEAADAAAARSGGTEAYRSALATLALELLPVSHGAGAALIRLPGINDRLRAVSGNAAISPPSTWLTSLCIAVVLSLGAFLGSTGIAQDKAQTSLKDFIWKNAIPILRLENVDLKDTIATIEKISREVDPEGAGFQIHLSDDFARPEAEITLKLTNVPFSEGLRYISALAGGQFRVTSDGVVFENKKEEMKVGGNRPAASIDGIERFLATRIPLIEFAETPFEDAIDFLEEKMREMDPEKSGVEIRIPRGLKERKVPVSFRLVNIELGQALKHITAAVGATFLVDSDHILIVGKEEKDVLLYTVVFQVSPSRFSDRERSATETLKVAGVDFPEGTSAVYNRGTQQLIIRNTGTNLEKVKKWLGK